MAKFIYKGKVTDGPDFDLKLHIAFEATSKTAFTKSVNTALTAAQKKLSQQGKDPNQATVKVCGLDLTVQDIKDLASNTYTLDEWFTLTKEPLTIA